jgi:RNA recognition motif-containing protein
METRIYVGNLSYETTEDDLRTLFAQAGTVSSVALIKDRDTGQSKGFAFVEMSNQSEAEKAIQTFNVQPSFESKPGPPKGRTRLRRWRLR